jgi:DNA-binding MarR family transcriptional regulator
MSSARGSRSIAKAVDVSTIAPPTDAGAVGEFGQSISYLIGAISNLLSARGSQFYRRHFGIGLAEWRLMWVLGIEPTMTARRASLIMAVDKAAVSRAVAGLERRGLLQATRDPADNRQRLIALSPAGHALYRKMIVVSRERQSRLFAPLSDTEQCILAALLRRLHAHLAGADEFDPRSTLETDPGSA